MWYHPQKSDVSVHLFSLSGIMPQTLDLCYSIRILLVQEKNGPIGEVIQSGILPALVECLCKDDKWVYVFMTTKVMVSFITRKCTSSNICMHMMEILCTIIRLCEKNIYVWALRWEVGLHGKWILNDFL